MHLENIFQNSLEISKYPHKIPNQNNFPHYREKVSFIAFLLTNVLVAVAGCQFLTFSGIFCKFYQNNVMADLI